MDENPMTFAVNELADQRDAARAEIARLKEWQKHAEAFIASSATVGLLEAAWGIIANASNGNWHTQTEEWQAAANRWRKDYSAAQIRLAAIENATSATSATSAPAAPSQSDPSAGRSDADDER